MFLRILLFIASLGKRNLWTTRSPLSAQIQVAELSSLPRHQGEEMKVLNISIPGVGIEPTTIAFTVR